MPLAEWEDSDPLATRPVAEINVTPLVDVMLVLLVIFIITAPLLSSSLNIDLPKAAATQPLSVMPQLRIVIQTDGTLMLNQQTLSQAQLAQQLARAAQKNTQQEVLIQADAKVAYGTVLAVMGAAQAVGLRKIGFVAEPVAGDP